MAALSRLVNLNPIQSEHQWGSVPVDPDQFEGGNSTRGGTIREYQLRAQTFTSESPAELTMPLVSNDSTDNAATSPLRLRTSFTHFAPRHVVKNRFMELQRWEGVVTEISKEAFCARLVDLTGGDSDLEADFALDEVHREDKELIQLGAVFYWTIGYIEDRGQRIRASVIRFRRLPSWQKHELEAAEREADSFRKQLDWD